MSSDLVERLRAEQNADYRGNPPSHHGLCGDAADTIERLRALVREAMPYDLTFDDMGEWHRAAAAALEAGPVD